MTLGDSPGATDDRNLQQLLASRVAAGDLPAWQWVYETYFDQLYRYVYYRAGDNVHVAEDIVQETFKELPKALAGFEGKSCDLYAYLLGIARRKLNRHYTKDRRSRVTLSAFSSAELPRLLQKLDREPLAGEELTHQDLLKFLRVALSELEPFYASVLMEKYARGKTVKEIASDLGKSEHAVESLLARARARLRDAIDKLRKAHFKKEEL